jgi:hypothetical protein
MLSVLNKASPLQALGLSSFSRKLEPNIITALRAWSGRTAIHINLVSTILPYWSPLNHDIIIIFLFPPVTAATYIKSITSTIAVRY